MNNNPALRKKSVYISIEKLIGTIAGQLYLLTDSSNWAFIFECMQHVNKTLLKLNTSNIDGWEYFYIRDSELYNLTKIHKVNFKKVKGHSTNELNNRCDELAREAIKNL